MYCFVSQYRIMKQTFNGTKLMVFQFTLMSCLLTKVLSTIKDGLVRYCNTKTSHNGVNNMWILKNSTSLLSSLDQLDVRTATSVQTFDFSTLYTSIPHDLLKSRISNLVQNCFQKERWECKIYPYQSYKSKRVFHS